MHQSVIDKWHDFSAPLEGRVATMYADCKGLITTGVGNLINTLPGALALPWLLADGLKASADAVKADWNKLAANRPYFAARKWSVYSPGMLCHLSDEAIDALVQRTIASNEAIIRKRFPAWDSLPADAQLAIMSVAWAVGSGFFLPKPQGPGFTNLARCIDAQDWVGCAAACTIREKGNPGVVPRNAKNRFCFHNAALVRANGLDAGTLCWPEVADPFENHVAVDATAAKAEAEAAQAAWQAHALNRAVDVLYDGVRNDLNRGAAQHQRDWDRHDTDPSELAPASEGGRS